MPMPNHAIWRTATDEPARPGLRFASVMALRHTRPVAAPSNGQSTFWINRRSINIRLSREPDHRDLLEEDRAEDLLRDRGRHVAAVTAALDDHHDDHFGIFRRRERREPRVVLTLLGFRLGDDLGGARLARDVEPGNARGDAGAAFVHDGPERLTQERPDDGRELD